MSRLPLVPVVAYHKVAWLNWTRIVNIDPKVFNVICLFHAVPTSVRGGFVFKPATDLAQLKADIDVCRARGQKVLVTVGGAFANVLVVDEASAQEFLKSFKALVQLLGGRLDGLDLNNFEGVRDPRMLTWLPIALAKVREAGSDENIFTCPPSATHWPGTGPTDTASQARYDRSLCYEMHELDVLDMAWPQYYDGPGLPDPVHVESMTRYYAEVLPTSKLGIGFGIAAEGATIGTKPANWWTSPDARKCYDAVRAKVGVKGAAMWATDTDRGLTFDAAFAGVATPPVNDLVIAYERGVADGKKLGRKEMAGEVYAEISNDL